MIYFLINNKTCKIQRTFPKTIRTTNLKIKPSPKRINRIPSRKIYKMTPSTSSTTFDNKFIKSFFQLFK